jgi:hypothetical protein
MKSDKKKRLEAKGWKIGSTAEFLGLTPEESAYVELKVVLSRMLHDKRVDYVMTQTYLAEKLGSSQSRVAKMEKADPSVSVDLLVRSLYALGTSNREIASVIAESAPEYPTGAGKRHR